MHANESYEAARNTMLTESSLKEMLAKERRFDNAVYALSDIPFDPRFNSVNWMFDCFQLVKEIVHSYYWMSAYASEASNQQGTQEEFRLQYYADNCITRINSFRDKAALCAWAYYCPFNPNNKEEVLGFTEVLKRLRHPVRFGLAIKRQGPFVAQLEKLEGCHFKKMKTYRDCKIHRLEPKILMQLPGPSDGLFYMVPLAQEREISQFDARLEEQYTDDVLRKIVKERCRINGVLFDRIPVKEEHWHYPEVEKAIRKCTHTCVDVAKELSVILMRRAPLKRRKGK